MQRLPEKHPDLFFVPGSLKAPLATFDTVDLGDEDIQSVSSSTPSQVPPIDKEPVHDSVLWELCTFASKIGAAQSKGRDPARKPSSESHCPQSSNELHLKQDSHDAGQDILHKEALQGISTNLEDEEAPTPTNQSPHESPVKDLGSCTSVQPLTSTHLEQDSTLACQNKTGDNVAISALPRIGKISVPCLRHQDSDSSSSSGSGSEIFTSRVVPSSGFTPAAFDDDELEAATPRTQRRLLKERHREYPLNFYPEDLDPSQISSPSKRKAFEKRLQRLQVKTSPITRPRSTTPINVVTLDEYACNSPDISPALSPGQEKLKITLPGEEFSPRLNRSPHRLNKSEVAANDSCFTFHEEILFSHTRSALVVEQVGQVPLSPRRVLIPPTLSPSSSPKLARAAGWWNGGENTTQLLYVQNEKTDNELVFGEPAGQQAQENWATFTESAFTESDQTDSGSREDSSLDAPFEFDLPEHEEILTVNIQTAGANKPANIEVLLSTPSSCSSSNSSPESLQPDEEKSPSGGDAAGDNHVTLICDGRGDEGHSSAQSLSTESMPQICLTPPSAEFAALVNLDS